MSLEETEDILERLTLAADSLPSEDERDAFMRELLAIRESLALPLLSAELPHLAIAKTGFDT